ncbi:MAG: thioredoxin domain-containing protein [Sandaracinaceae bacterium]|nr:thioredoxin domain-containing protein [Sandaracinaceae bacterium]
MNKGTAVIAILIAFVGGLTLGHITGNGSGVEGEEIAAEGGAGSAAGAAEAGEAERFRVPVTAAQPSRGPADALVTIVQFSDFQCPFCSRVEPTVTQLLHDYGNKIRVVWRNNPLPFHQNAGPAAQAAAEAFKQGGSAKFWRMHELMFQNQTALTRPDLERYAQQAGLDMTAFRAALDGNTHQAEIAADQALANSLGARGTPFFFINGRQVQGAQPITAFKEIIDDEVTRAERLVRTGVARNRVYAELTAHGRTEAAAPAANPNAAPQAPRAQPDPNAVYNVPVGTSPVRGRADALVTVVIFSEFQCPFCKRVEPTLTTLRERYGNDIRFVWKNNPLPFHPNAGPAAELAMAANAVGKFWEAHDLLFENQAQLERADLERYATQLGLNLAAVRTAIDTNQYQAAIQADQQLASRLGARGTPAFFINGRNLSGAQPLENFTRLIDEELAKARAKVAAGTPRNRVYEETIRNGATTAQTIAPPAGAAAPAAAPGAPNPDQVYNMPIPATAPRKGGARARVVIQQVSDYQCPFCSRVEPTVDRILQEYGDRVAVVWRDFPLPFHQNAMPAAEAAREVLAQGGQAKFWQYHALLFANQQTLDRPSLERFAEQVGGINMARFRTALDSHTHQAAIQADAAAATTALGQVGTPTFLINGRMISGAQPFENFKAAIDRALAEPAR